MTKQRRDHLIVACQTLLVGKAKNFLPNRTITHPDVPALPESMSRTIDLKNPLLDSSDITLYHVRKSYTRTPA